MLSVFAVESESENFLMLLVLALLRFVLTIVVESENIELSYALGICCRNWEWKLSDALGTCCRKWKLSNDLGTCCRKWKWKLSNALSTCIAEGCFVLQAEPQGIVDHRKQIHFQSQTGIWKKIYEHGTWKLSMVAYDYKCLNSILNLTFWSTRAHELMEPFPTQSKKHHLSSSAPRSVTLEVILGGKLARLAGRLPGASGRQSSPGGFAFYFHKNLNWSQFQSRPVAFT